MDPFECSDDALFEDIRHRRRGLDPERVVRELHRNTDSLRHDMYTDDGRDNVPLQRLEILLRCIEGELSKEGV